MTEIVKRVWICAPAENVWAVAADFAHPEHWAPTVKECRCPNQIRRGVGARRILTTTSGHVTEEVVLEWREGERYTLRIPNGVTAIAILQETWYFERMPQGAEVIVVMAYQTKNGVIDKVMESLFVRRLLTRMLIENLAGLKHYIETGERVTPKTTNLPISAVTP